jgi:ADP-dependent phosphofructokinase/glucokinase
MSWPEVYQETASRVLLCAPTARPVFTGTNACVDAIFRVDADRLARIVSAAGTSAAGSALMGRVLDRIGQGRGGELLTRWPSGPAWIMDLLGEPDRYQVGGTGPQASWALATLGARSVLALADRSAAQLAVIDPRAGLCSAGAVVPAGTVMPHGEPSKEPHCILEFTAGTTSGAVTVSRSSRVILRFGDEPVEQDEEYLATTADLAPGAGAGLVSGLNGPPDDDRSAQDWVLGLARAWSRSGLPVIHHELAEFPSVQRLREAAELAPVTSVGLSLSELFMLAGTRGDPRVLARDLGERSGAGRVIVHADDWALAVSRGGQADPELALLTGNLLAAARAQAGRPTDDLAPPADARYVDDRPPDGAMGDGWHACCVPAPHLRKPVATIGLGDTFVAGVLLADSLRYPPTMRRN